MIEMVSQFNLEQLILAALTLTTAGIIGFWIRDVPMRVWFTIKRQCTTSLSITSSHRVFYNLMSFLQENYANKNFRTFKLTNGKWGNWDTTTIGLGFGSHLIKFENLYMHIHLAQEDSQGTTIDKETITITKLGRSRKKFERFFHAISADKENESNIQIYTMDEHWRPINQIPKRPMDTVFMEQEKKSVLLKAVDNFIKDEKWYLDNGIPYHLGILLYGSPGTGKSSLIKSVASYMGYDIFYLPISNLDKIEYGMNTLPEKSIIVIEDIDCENVLHNRDGDKENQHKNSKESKDVFSFANFSDVLNAIDGVCSTHGRILITTTNHIEKLDPALIRPGRIDLKIEVGYVGIEIFNQFTKRFFGREISLDTRLKENLTCAELQNMLLNKRSFEEIVISSKPEA